MMTALGAYATGSIVMLVWACIENASLEGDERLSWRGLIALAWIWPVVLIVAAIAFFFPWKPEP